MIFEGKRAEQQKLLNRMLGHDLGNQLVAASGLGDAVKETLAMGASAEANDLLLPMLDSLEQARRCWERLKVLCCAGVLPLPVEAVDLDTLVESSLRMVATPLAAAEREASAEGSFGEVAYAEDFLRFILTAYLDNAVRHGGGAVTVRALPGGFSVEDEGSGVEPGKKALLFGPLEDHEKRKEGRMGEGLAMVRLIAEEAGGTYTHDCSGVVTRFTFQTSP
jgi:signal transduction histidine kinase